MTLSKHPQKIKDMFNLIANRYDFNNSLISLGLHKFVKAQSVEYLSIKNNSKILDECTGTGDFVQLILKNHHSVNITGADFSENMLKIAKTKVPTVEFVQADATNLPFENETFDIITMGFGLRNIEDYTKAITEANRVLKSGGEFLHLDFGRKNFCSKIFDFLVPPLIRIFYGNKIPYTYLLQSKKEFPEPQELIKVFENFGFKLKCRKDFLFGVISMQIFNKV